MRPKFQWRTQVWHTIATLFLHSCCPLCDRPASQDLCSSCWRQLQQCAAPPGWQPSSSASNSPDGLPVIAWGAYRPPLKQAIAALKYQQHCHLARPLGKALASRWISAPLKTRQPPWVVPIPLHLDKQKARGFNQAELIAEAFCQHTGLKLVRHGLTRSRSTAPQFALGPAARQKNLAGAFALGPAFQKACPPRPILLLDDIYTTGTTVRAAAKTLRRHQISVCGVVAVAYSSRHT